MLQLIQLPSKSAMGQVVGIGIGYVDEIVPFPLGGICVDVGTLSRLELGVNGFISGCWLDHFRLIIVVCGGFLLKAALLEDRLNLAVSEHGYLLFGERSLDTIGVVAEPVVFFILLVWLSNKER